MNYCECGDKSVSIPKVTGPPGKGQLYWCCLVCDKPVDDDGEETAATEVELDSPRLSDIEEDYGVTAGVTSPPGPSGRVTVRLDGPPANVAEALRYYGYTDAANKIEKQAAEEGKRRRLAAPMPKPAQNQAVDEKPVKPVAGWMNEKPPTEPVTFDDWYNFFLLLCMVVLVLAALWFIAEWVQHLYLMVR